LKKPLKICKRFSYFAKIGFFERTLEKMQAILIFHLVGLLSKNLGNLET
jgi:hypothetical protein